MIPNELLEKYYMKNLDGYKQDLGDSTDIEIMFYKAFLKQTDHIPNKIIEAQLLNEEYDDYTEILNLRKQCRAEINKIEAEIAKGEV